MCRQTINESEYMYHGMLTIRKEAGYTSSDVVARLRGILHMKKIGHTGTLDPDAEGVLPVCLGTATKLCDLIADRDKEYRAVMRLGVTTDTQDMSGTVLQSIPEEEVLRLVDEKRLLQAAEKFTGEIMQIPPMYSAVKVGGKRLYEIARKGGTVERAARPVTIYELSIESVQLPLVTMRVRCGKGTYIRTLCHDMGEALGTGAAMEHLVRTRVGIFTLDQAVLLDDAERMMKTELALLERMIMPVDGFFAEYPGFRVKEEGMKLLLNGNPVASSMTEPVDDGAQCVPDRMRGGQLARMYGSGGRFEALYRYDRKNAVFRNYKMFHAE